MKMRHPEFLLKRGSQGKGLKSLLEPIGKFRDVLYFVFWQRVFLLLLA